MSTPKPFPTSAVLVDGENVSRMDLMLLTDEICKHAVRRFYTTVTVRPAKLESLRYPFELVQTPRIGKESVDRVVAMEMVDLAYQGVTDFYLVSNDYDFGDTAAHFKRMYPGVNVTIVADPTRISEEYPGKLEDAGVGIMESMDQSVSELAIRALSLLREHTRGYRVPLSWVGKVFCEHGFPFHKGALAKDVERLGFHVEDGKVQVPRGSPPGKGGNKPRF
jgi:hypothetical protein